MLRKLKDAINNLLVLIVRKKDSSRKIYHELNRISYIDSAEFIYSKIGSALLFTNIQKFWTYSFKDIKSEGLIMEFGVFSGNSINFFSTLLKEKNDIRKIYGFDSFEGLSEAWGGTTLGKGYFDVNGVLPRVNDNVELVKGWVNVTFPDFLLENKLDEKKIAFMHLDVDTYTPTKLVLELAQRYFLNGTIIVFDELLGYPGWREHEFKALREAIDQHWNYEFIAFCEVQRKDFTSDHIRAAIRITNKK